MAAFEAGFHLLVFIALANTVISFILLSVDRKSNVYHAFRSSDSNFPQRPLHEVRTGTLTLGIIGLGIASIVYQSIDKLSFGI